MSRPGDNADVQVWRLTAPWGKPDLAVLDLRERRRACAFVRPGDRERYVAAHTALRRILAPYVRLAPQDVPFVRLPCARCDGPHGRPALDPAHPTPHFSISHSGAAVLIAVSAARVGVDVQRTPPARTVAACTPALHPDEQRELAALATADRGRAFARIWTRKEAYLKALGTGLCRPPRLDFLGTHADSRPPGWAVVDLRRAGDYNAAVAVRGEAAHPPVLYHLPPFPWPSSVDREGATP